MSGQLISTFSFRLGLDQGAEASKWVLLSAFFWPSWQFRINELQFRF